MIRCDYIFFFFPHWDFRCILASVLACVEMSSMSTSALEKQKQLYEKATYSSSQ